jgi:hypothetical protein
MGAGKARVLAGRGTVGGIVAGIVALGAAALATACGHVSAGAAPAAGQTTAQTATGTATPTVAPSTVPVLGALTLGPFPATQDGESALALCEQWAQLRAQYVPRLRTDTRFQLEQWFSSIVWQPAFAANSPLHTDPNYANINVAFGLASTAAAASVSTARMLDKSCAAAD